MSDVVEEFTGDIRAIPFYNPPIPKSDPGKIVDDEFNADLSRMPVVVEDTKIASDKQARKLLAQEALQWPRSSMKEECLLPLGVAAAVALYFAPLTVPNIGLGELVVASYAAGALTYYLEFQNKFFSAKK